MEEKTPWYSISLYNIFISQKKDTHKAILQTSDNQKFESVLMENRTGAWTICVSSQIGCAMKCSFCATGTMGIKRNLSSDEIVDQYRFWNAAIQPHERISNIVFMGMGEPLANYENVRHAINQILKHTDIGRTKITVSSVGIIPQLERILTDKSGHMFD